MPALRLVLLIVCSSCLLAAQMTVATVRIATNPPGLKVSVDGAPYSQTTTMFWTAGSPHVLAAEIDELDRTPGVRYTFHGWTDSSGRNYGAAPAINVTADPSVWLYTAVFRAEYLLELSYFRCDYASPSMCGSIPGTVTVNGASFWKDTVLWLTAGSEVHVTAQPNPGYAFAGWENYFADPRSPQQVFTIRSAWVLQPRFVPAASFTVASSPPGLQVRVDGAPVRAPRTFQWEPGVEHAVAPVSPQQDEEGRYWWFDSWSDGGDAEHAVYGRPVQDAQTVTALYVPATVVTVLTEPFGLKVTIDGSDTWPSPNFIWGVGSTHQLTAPAEQTGKSGRRYAFRGWSDGVESASREIAAAEGLRLAARYELLGRLTVDSTPAGQTIRVAGQPCVTPCTLDRAAGTQIALEAPASIPAGGATRLDFRWWDDQAPRERVWTFSTEARRVAAIYQIMHRVDAAADPAEGAGFLFDPPSDDGYYPAGTRLRVVAAPQPGFAFKGWRGDLDGAGATEFLAVTQPRSVIAVLERVPYVAPAGVLNAAGETPERAVAAGSIISIYGAHLAPDTVTGPANPMAQTLAGVTVEAGGRLLPLLFVSPQQINALVPSDFKAGTYSLSIRATGQPAVSAEFRLARNAPGLFALFLRTDGSLVLPENPARPGEVLTMFGTGFGPLFPAPLDGFPVPEEPEFLPVDPVILLAGDSLLPAPAVKAAAGFSGLAAVTFQAPDAPPEAAVRLKVRVNGHESNSVPLPVSGR
ncbi:MAG: hypothetical protein IT159_08630 [Bryobacterales bacterium]|nr:hypothetical protein [Bryobacterales bacterium]